MTSIVNINLVGNRSSTKKQMETLSFVQEFSGKNKRTPTLKEIAEYFRISMVSVYERKLRIERNMPGQCSQCGNQL